MFGKLTKKVVFVRDIPPFPFTVIVNAKGNVIR
jgi:hypothetical protein